ncbi:MAG: carboxypeptidase-like regulatory domain-containing protein, partial [Bryobacteraceae bacterium]
MGRLIRILAYVFVLALAAGLIQAQITQSSILGNVVDSSGAAIVKAAVIATNQDTGIERAVTTNEGGDYRVAGLEPGRYSVKVSAKGFQTVLSSGIVLVANQERRVDV